MTLNFKTYGALAISTLTMAACEPGPPPSEVEPSASATVSTTVAVEPTRIETQLEPRPDIFSVRDMALWDGRPSLGGPWVAHPDVRAAERVEITNLSNNIVTTAALFRRERALPGPAFQLSAEAAIALNVPAGVPVQLSVVAVREGIVETPVEAPAAPEPATQAEPAIVAVADEVAAEPAAVTPEPDPEREPAPTVVPTPAPIQEPEPEPTPTTAPAPDEPFMQVGMFGVPSNAEALVERLIEAGLPASGRPAGSLTRVVVGPAASTQELAGFRDRLRSLGFTDSISIALE